MSAKDLSPAELEERLWKEIGSERIVMLGLVGGEPHHMQPMAAFGDKRAGLHLVLHQDHHRPRARTPAAAMMRWSA